MKIAIIGQSLFGAQVYQQLIKRGHDITGVFTIPDVNGREDPLATAAHKLGSRVFKLPRWRLKGQALPEALEAYKSVGAELNVLAFCSQFVPMEVINAPRLRSIIYHPSLLPLHRGASAVNWTLISGDLEGGFTVFWADDGLDTGPILLQRRCNVTLNDTVDSIYTRFMLPEGVKGMVEAVELISGGRAPSIPQHDPDGTYDAIVKKSTAEINWSQTGMALHNFIRGHDKVPGAWGFLEDKKVTFFGSELWCRTIQLEDRDTLKVRGLSEPAVLHSQGLLIQGIDGQWINVRQLKFEETGDTIQAANYGKTDELATVTDLTPEETQIQTKLQSIWASILLGGGDAESLSSDSDFFRLGGGSMDVTRLTEAVRQGLGLTLLVDEVYLCSQLGRMTASLVLKHRLQAAGGDASASAAATASSAHSKVRLHINDMDVSFPHQVFINNEFCDSESTRTFQTINPADESTICDVSLGSKKDVDRAVRAAQDAFEFGEWGKMNARDRGRLLYKLADLMDSHKEELATIESLDSGAVYTLALKTHVGMSIDTFRYFAGWCDKIEGSVIPINHARPNKNLTFTKREPIGVCGLVVPWNYPLMMLAWKSAACLAAGNTLVLKPAQVTPLTALKFCELIQLAGFPPGVFNVIPGSGGEVGQRMIDHPDIRKLGFTGSTAVGKTIMAACAKSNLKKCSLELGGKSPLIIFADCDQDKAVKAVCSSVFFNKGENCIAAGRIFVDVRIHTEFVERVVAEVAQLRVGDPLDRSVDHGPQNHRAHLLQLLEYCAVGQREGATLVCGGKRCDRPGFFMEPTVFTGVTDDMHIAKEESFGPVMIISKFHDLEEVVARANRTEYALASGVFARDVSTALTVADKLEAGTVFVNTYNKTDVAAPFGGFKQSGFGKDLGQEALNEYLKTKTVTVEY